MSGRKGWMPVLLIAAFLALASVAVAKTLLPRHYVGSTSQGYALDFKVSKSGKLVTMKYSYDVICPTLGSALPITGTKDTWKVSKARTFTGRWSFPTDLPDEPEVGSGNLTGIVVGSTSGKLGAKRATGRFTEHLTVKDGTGAAIAECDTGAVKLRAKPAM